MKPKEKGLHAFPPSFIALLYLKDILIFQDQLLSFSNQRSAEIPHTAKSAGTIEALLS